MHFFPIMQRNIFYASGLQNTGPFTVYPQPIQNSEQYPEIVGEGDVTSVILPNGGVQYFFIPTLKHDFWTPFPYNPAAMNSNWNFSTQAWFVRNISNPNPTPNCTSQYLPRPREDPFATSYFPPDFNAPALGYNVFHYDKWTSTTDLRYFYPSQCHFNPAKYTASVQMEKPVTKTICHYQVLCDRPCHCLTKCNSDICMEKTFKHEEKKLKSVGCCMSVEEVKACERPSQSQKCNKSVSMDTYPQSNSTERQKGNKSSFSKKRVELSDCDGKCSKKRKNRPIIKLLGKCENGCCCSSSGTSEAE